VVLDECSYLRKAFYTGTVYESGIAEDCYQQLKVIVRNAKTVILAQYALTESDVAFYANMKGVDMYGSEVFQMKFEWTGLPPRVFYYVEDEVLMFYRVYIF